MTTRPTRPRARRRPRARLWWVLTAAGVAAVAAPAVRAQNQVTLVVSLANYGYIQACSCGAEALGGLGRRATLFDRLRQEHPNAIFLDAGDLARSDTKQPEMETIVEAYERLGYDGVRIGLFDHRTGHGAQLMRQSTLPILEEGYAPTYFQRGGVTVAVFNIPMVYPRTQIHLEDLVPQAIEGIKAARPRAQVVVALTQLPETETNIFIDQLTKGGAPVDILVTDVLQSPETKVVGPTLLVNPGINGKYLSLFQITVEPGGTLDIQHETVKVELDLPDRPDLQLIVDDYLTRTNLGLMREPVREFQSSAECASCHEHAAAYEAWRKSRHSLGLHTLEEDTTNPPKGSAASSPQCLHCHAGAYREYGSLDPRTAGIECITCHGNDAHNRRGAFVPESVCLECHDADNSPNFDFEEYTRLIRHWSDDRDAEFHAHIAAEREKAARAEEELRQRFSGAPATAAPGGSGPMGVLMVAFVVLVLAAAGVIIYRVAFPQRS